MRTPGHGGQCFPGRIVSTTPDPGIPTTQWLYRAQSLGWRKTRLRIWWKVLCNMETIRFAMVSTLVIAQIWIDVVCIMLWR
jgi:hypothetical protein